MTSCDVFLVTSYENCSPQHFSEDNDIQYTVYSIEVLEKHVDKIKILSSNLKYNLKLQLHF